MTQRDWGIQSYHVIKTNTHTSSVIPALHEITALEKLCAVLELVERIVLGWAGNVNVLI